MQRKRGRIIRFKGRELRKGVCSAYPVIAKDLSRKSLS